MLSYGLMGTKCNRREPINERDRLRAIDFGNANKVQWLIVARSNYVCQNRVVRRSIEAGDEVQHSVRKAGVDSGTAAKEHRARHQQKSETRYHYGGNYPLQMHLCLLRQFSNRHTYTVSH